MDFSELLAALAASGIDTLAGFDRDAALRGGLNPARVRSWQRVHEVYFGATKWTAQQRRALEQARAGGMSLHQLEYIETRLRRIDDARERWRLRHQLLAVRGDFKALQAAARRILPPAAPKPPSKKLSFTGSRGGMRGFTGWAPERQVADLESALRRDLDLDQPEAPQLMDAFLALFGGNRGGSGPAVPPAAPRPIVLVPLDAHIDILGGRGDDTLLRLTDGTTMTGAQYLATIFGKGPTQAPVAGIGEVALFHPSRGAVNLYRTQRYANTKQRVLASLTAPGCPVPGCRHGAHSCQIHHITAWQHGGETNLANLAPLCRYHNRANDDDPRAQSRGRVQMVRNVPRWVSPGGKAVANSRHGPGAMELLFNG